MESLLTIFQSFDDTSKQKILACFHKKYLQRGDLLLKRGRVSSYLAFVEQIMLELEKKSNRNDFWTFVY